MKPVALLQHDRTQRPGFLLDYLNETGIPSVTFTPEEGHDVPRSARDFSGLVLLGSQHSVNDRLPWIDKEVALVRDAMAADIPVLGHCFGGQLIAKSLGATVCRNAWANIGWSRLRVTPHARTLFGASEIVAFNWHHETFSIPQGAHRTLFGEHCLNKAFSIGKHLAFQCHFEVTEDIVREWCSNANAELEAAAGPAVQRRHEILSRLRDTLPSLHRVARQVYRHWASGLTRPPVAHYHGGW
jgi:GMP synthase (glutamine-hydrolysing)